MSLRIYGATSGYIELDAPAVANSASVTLPTTSGVLATVPGSWISYTPQLTNLTLGTGGTSASKYLILGKLVYFYGVLVLGTGFSIGDAQIGLPSTAISNSAINMNVQALDFGTQIYPLFISNEDISNTRNVRILATNSAGTYTNAVVLSSTVPFTWVAGDKIYFSGFYESS